MDAVQKDDKVVAPNPVPAPISAGRVEAGSATAVENSTAALEAGSSYPDFKPPQGLEPFTQPSVRINIPAPIASIPRVSDMGTAVIDLKQKRELFEKGDVTDSGVDEAGVEVRQEDREELLGRAA